jgi:hypothetical protein
MSTKFLTNGRQALFSHNASDALMMSFKPATFNHVTFYSENLTKENVAVTPQKNYVTEASEPSSI